MRAFAEFVMRSRSHAVGASVAASVLPLVHWIGAAVVALVVLRRGAAEGGFVLLWASLPLVGWYAINNDAMPLMVLGGTFCLGWVLRETLSWELTLAAAVVLSVLAGLTFQVTSAEALALIVDWYFEAVDVAQDVTRDQAAQVLIGLFAMGHTVSMLVAIMLARWWQSTLYNPGGFQQEFHGLRLSPAMSAVIVALIVLGFVLDDPAFGRWLPLLTVPLVLSGIGFVHWFVGSRKLSTSWLVGFYIAFLLMVQIVYPLLASIALMDSGLDLRKRIEQSNRPDDEV